jgi:hypothetical protein
MGDFEKDRRRQQELKFRPLVEPIYRDHLKAVSVRYLDGTAWDKKFGMDAAVKMETGQVLTVQEKVLSYKFRTFNSLTFECMQDPTTGEPGDWFRLYANLYFIAYANEAEDGFDRWALIDIATLKIYTAHEQIDWIDNKNQDGHAKASFKYTNVARLPDVCVLFSRGFGRL